MKTTESTLTHHLDSATRTLRAIVPGDLLSTNADSLRESLFDLLETSPGETSQWNTFTLDLRAAQMIDSVGLNLIVALLRALRTRGAKFQVVVTNPSVHRSFLFTRLDNQLELLKS